MIPFVILFDKSTLHRLLLYMEGNSQDDREYHNLHEDNIHAFFSRNTRRKSEVESLDYMVALHIFHRNIYILVEHFLHNYNYNLGMSMCKKIEEFFQLIFIRALFVLHHIHQFISLQDLRFLLLSILPLIKHINCLYYYSAFLSNALCILNEMVSSITCNSTMHSFEKLG